MQPGFDALVRGKLLAAGYDPDEIYIGDWLDFVFALALEPPGGFVNGFEYREAMIQILTTGVAPPPEREESSSSGRARPKSRMVEVNAAIRELNEMNARLADRQSQEKPAGE